MSSTIVIHQMYLHREDILLVLTKSQGTKYENIADRFIDSAEKHYRLIADAMIKYHPKAKLDDKFIHWLAHEQIDTFFGYRIGYRNGTIIWRDDKERY